MLAIAIDSSQDICALALGTESRLVAEYHFHHKMSLLRRMLPNIDELLSDAGLSKGDIEGVVISLGPGSFTGLRIGVTTAKSLAYVLGKPIVGIGALDAIARGVPCPSDGIVCPMIFARADEVYWALFDARSNERLTDYAVSRIAEVLDAAGERGTRVAFVGTGARKNLEVITARFGEEAVVRDSWYDFARGAALLSLGLARLEMGQHDDPMTLAPLYVRKPTPQVRLEAGKIVDH